MILTESKAKIFKAQSLIFNSPLFQKEWYKKPSERLYPYDLLHFFISKYKLNERENDFDSTKYEIQKRGNFIYLTDPEKPPLAEGEMEVYPYFDEALTLSRLVSGEVERRENKFSLAIDPFCGGGHSGIPMIANEFAEKASLSDINPRAVNLAKANLEINDIQKFSPLEKNPRVSVELRDITKDGIPDSDSPGNTLYIANPPFALKAKGASMAVMRDGGENGLALTLSFAGQALEKSVHGDVIIGIGYSRITPEGEIEMKRELEKLVSKFGGILDVSLLEGEALWRGFNGKKEQPNPMQITEETFSLKANPEKAEEVTAYETAARFHREQGYDKLGYFSYIIRK
ncbi:hypothetical protein M1328_01630 [Patescibacteria group bacterium]|nr:hypothetical protein [Patescibacteria group bacterium]